MLRLRFERSVVIMPDREMTPSEAIIILDRLNTEERIDIDRDELRAAIKVAKAAMLKQEKRAVGTFCGFFLCVLTVKS